MRAFSYFLEVSTAASSACSLVTALIVAFERPVRRDRRVRCLLAMALCSRSEKAARLEQLLADARADALSKQTALVAAQAQASSVVRTSCFDAFKDSQS